MSSQNNEFEITQRKILSYISDIWIEMKMAAKSDIWAQNQDQVKQMKIPLRLNKNRVI